ncbi:uncharacterized protein EV420DRAFT_1651305 [Desarmillaria tabescens]|uniref:Uncharacterized protein n=1 Tax=Armillaria tabescens TaxID=1929756 RepID=A0AA39JB40_ARMTA|nr:uncharacterized protein EV420DRAFT_1651305 [Desarmillaria tabescens]KAK0438717.1 hypothetical protein EV420DRAFT_1651305 [Desarmillaria tabescens]
MSLTLANLHGKYPLHSPKVLEEGIEQSIAAELVELVGPAPEVQLSKHPPHPPSMPIICTAEGPYFGQYFQTCKDPSASLVCSTPIPISPPFTGGSDLLTRLLEIRVQIQAPMPTKVTILLWDEDGIEPCSFLVTPNHAGRVRLCDNAQLLRDHNPQLTGIEDYLIYRDSEWIDMGWESPVFALPGSMLLVRVASVQWLDGFDVNKEFV